MVGEIIKSNTDNEYWWRSCHIVSGFDIGKKQNPSHISVFAITEDKMRLILIMQRFLDSWEYTKQVKFIEACVEYFNIDRMYYDNTRGEFEERNLPRQCEPIVLGRTTGRKSKGEMEMAVNFAKMIEQQRIELIDNDRFISQITCMSNDLKAPSTPMGHADSFWSVCLAIAAYYDYFAPDRNKGTIFLGNLGEQFQENKKTAFEDNEVCKICNRRTLTTLENGRRKCSTCFAEYDIN